MPTPHRSGLPVNGAAIRVIRERTGLSQERLAEAVGISRTYLTNIEGGRRRRTSPRVALGLAHRLDVPLDAIMTVPDSGFPCADEPAARRPA